VDFRDVAQARNAGARGEWTDFLLFVDADNWLPPNFHRKLLTAMGPNHIGVTYSQLRWVDVNGTPLGLSRSIKPFSRSYLERQNLADTCSLVRAEAFHQVGGWWGERSGFEDWFLWLKIVRAGWQMKLVADAEFYYRIHPQQMSVNTPRRDNQALRCLEMGQQIAVVAIFGGRQNLDVYFDALMKTEWHRDNLHLVAVDNSDEGLTDFREELKSRLANCGLGYSYTRYSEQAVAGVTAAQLSDTPDLRRKHHWEMQMHLIRLYTHARNIMPSSAALVWTLEDDVEAPPDALRKMACEMGPNTGVGIVAALVPNRFTKGYIAWTGPSMDKRRRIQNPNETPVIAVTFGCTLFRRRVWDMALRPSWNWSRKNGEAALDWSLGEDARQNGWQIRLVPVVCKHGGRTDSGWVLG